MDDSKRDLKAAIPESAIEEALRSVERLCTASPPLSPPPTEKTKPPENISQCNRLQSQLGEVRQELRKREAELGTSQEHNRQVSQELEEMRQLSLRAMADLENYKKRVLREKEEQRKFSQEQLLRDLLPIVDSLELALEHAQHRADVQSLQSGLALTKKMFDDTLSRFGVKSFTSLSTPFDPRFHEAIQSVESDLPSGMVIKEVARGYFLHERLIRPATVLISKGPAKN